MRKCKYITYKEIEYVASTLRPFVGEDKELSSYLEALSNLYKGEVSHSEGSTIRALCKSINLIHKK